MSCITVLSYCVSASIFSLDIAAIVIGSFDHSVCGKEVTNDVTVDPHDYLLYGGIVSLIGALMFACSSRAMDEIDLDLGIASARAQANGVFGACSGFAWILFIFVWAIIGFVVYGELPAKCQSSEVGEIMLAWAILKMILLLLFGYLFYRVVSILDTSKLTFPSPKKICVCEPYTLFQMFAIAFLLACDIAAIVIGSLDHSVCGQEVVEDVTIDPHVYLLCAGCIAFFATLAIAVAKFKIGLWAEDPGFYEVSSMCTLLFLFAWTIVGFVIYAELPGNCKLSEVGEIMMAWCVIHVISTFYLCVWLVDPDEASKSKT